MNLAITKIRNSILLNRYQHGAHRSVSSFTTHLLVLLFAAVSLTGCGGGATNEANPGANSTTTVTGYFGPPERDAFVAAYKEYVWDPLVEAGYCVSCHGTGGQVPSFVRNDDINRAADQALTVTNTTSPEQSILVTKVGGGHNCWLSNNSSCATVMTGYIQDWLNAVGAGVGGRDIVLVAPTDRDISNSRNFPADYSSFENTIYPILVANCSGCHSPVGTAGRQQPYFAYDDGDAATVDDIISSYEAAQPKIDLNDGDINPVDTTTLDLFNTNFVSRLYEKDPDDPTRIVGHNCWSGNCENDALEMATAVWNFANGITPVVVDPSLITSRALIFADDCEASRDCVVASGGNRYENDLIALWEFKEGSGLTVDDVSGVNPPINLELSGNVNWMGGYGLEFADGKAQDVSGASSRLNDSINPAVPGGSGRYSIEAWIVPDNVTQEDANIVSYSGNNDTGRNFTLGQTMYNYDYMHLSSTTPDPITDVLSTPDADEVLQATQQHVVTTFDPVNGRRIYVNGALTNAVDPFTGGGLTDWDDTFAFVLGNEVSDDRPWLGKMRLVAIHDEALTHEQIVQNFEAGVGEKYFLLFGIGHIPGVPLDSYIMFEVSQFDSYSYLFYKPTFINLDPGVMPNGIAIQGMRIGVNGSVPVVGQAYSRLDTTIDSSIYTVENGQVLSTLGTIIQLERGPTAPNPDEFFLTFEVLGTADPQPYIEPTVTAPPLINPDPVPDIGFRTFEEISASMSAMTGVATTNSAVRATYNSYIQQLPSVENIEGFLPSHQMAIAQLALTYCSELVDNNGGTYFAPFDFTQPAGSAFDTPSKRQQVLDPLMQRMLNMDPANPNLVTQPDETEMRDLLSANGPQSLLGDSGPADDFDSLITTMTQCLPGCNTTARTREIVKASCAAVLGSAATMVQ